ncbi:hypothetical protein BN7_3763 [Wickerhamomyces ciferrii]|uniref:Centromere protein X n=1 Tax=Wickerhamomyces ciferrii (strain ATCC 14091 / BCRC 22168 / CBS 111 / JCM 3599 / NBRC 0793 / NRRL Y-1031 F-60-10) TaxID=1206466 RepID=K0KS96_WICCF|nr:uncharacterized protein BN7_3763 [Wickerhamomyces ciferrii]CCH44204.1 hypothetical protein BN7_3763 [Wickerhamomyces ciferrii]
MTSEEETKIPITTLSRLFQTAVFEHEDSKITQQTLELSSEYLKMFIREAILRANDVRENPKDAINKGDSDALQNQLIGDVLDAQHLEEIAGLLVLDF